MEIYRLEVNSKQAQVNFDGIIGHIDLMVGDDLLIDVKTMCNDYFLSFTLEPNNDRGYLTQLSCYAADVKHAGFLCFNKDSGVLKFIELDTEVRDSYCDETAEKIEQLNLLNSPEDLAVLELPSGVPEIYKGQRTNRRLIPRSLQNFPFLSCFYSLENSRNSYGKKTVYVLDELETSEKIYRINTALEELNNGNFKRHY
jgi:hypothetical protein